MADEENEVVTTAEKTEEPIDKTSFLQGWLVGRRLAGMQKNKN